MTFVNIESRYGKLKCDLLSGSVKRNVKQKTKQNISKINNHLYKKFIEGKSNKYSAVAVLGYSCNLDCAYCFQGKLKGGNEIQEEKCAHDLICHLQKKFSIADKVSVAFSGGEPTLYLGVAEQVAKKMKTLAQEQSKSFECGFITNGVMKDEAINRLIAMHELGCAWVQMSIHARGVSYYKENLVENIVKLSGFKLALRFNVDEQEDRFFYEAIDFISNDQRIDPHAISVVIRDVQKRGCGDKEIEKNIYDKIGSLYEYALEKKFKVSVFSIFEQCNIGHNSSEIILPDTSLVPCIMFSSYDASIREEMLQAYQKGNCKISDFGKYPERCQQCKYFIFCMGGCRVNNYYRTNKMEIGICRKKQMEGVLKRILTFKVEKELGAKNAF